MSSTKTSTPFLSSYLHGQPSTCMTTDRTCMGRQYRTSRYQRRYVTIPLPTYINICRRQMQSELHALQSLSLITVVVLEGLVFEKWRLQLGCQSWGQGVAKGSCGESSLPSPSFHLFPSLPFLLIPPLSFLFLALPSGPFSLLHPFPSHPLKPSYRGSGEGCKFPQRVRLEPSRQKHFGPFQGMTHFRA